MRYKGFEKNKFVTKQGKTIFIRQDLNCKDFGIYAGQCLQCQEVYVGQTKNHFSTRWNTHRSMWRKHRNNNTIEDSSNDDQALVTHYKKYHQDINLQGLELWKAYRVIFIEKPSIENLDLAESMWIGKLNAKINISKTFLPIHKTI